MRGVRSLSGLAGPNASLKDAGGGGVSRAPRTFVGGGLQTLIVPQGVASMSFLCVGQGGYGFYGNNNYSFHGAQTYVRRSTGEDLCTANGGKYGRTDAYSGAAPGGSGGIKHGGGNGGTGYGDRSGGAGGFNGDATSYVTGTGWVSASSDAGSGGLSGKSGYSSVSYATFGGTLGLGGVGPTGADVETNFESGGAGSFGLEDVLGRGQILVGSGGGTRLSTSDGDVARNHGGGGETSWVRGISVTPGETLTIYAAQTLINEGNYYSGGYDKYLAGAVAAHFGDVDFLAPTGA